MAMVSSTRNVLYMRFPFKFAFPSDSYCHTHFPKKTKCITICMPGSSFMHIVTYKCIQKQYHVRKRKVIRVLRLILETKAPNITGSRLGLRTPSTSKIFMSSSCSFLLLGNIVYIKGEHLLYSASVGKDMNAKAL
jgi:hypothetical protein